MSRMYSLVILLTITSIMQLSTECYADNLKLTKSEMAQLKKLFSSDSENYRWTGKPIKIVLPIGIEKRIVFPSPVIPDLQGTLETKQLRIINNEGSLYLTALMPFESTRMLVTLQESQKVILIDLETSIDANGNDVAIKIDDNLSSSHISRSEESSTLTLNLPDLIRFSWQSLYAPTRLMPSVPGIQRVAMHSEQFTNYLIYGDKVLAHPIAEWSSGSAYITAVQLTNIHTHRTSIQLSSDVCGNWKAAVIYPIAKLEGRASRGKNSTTLFLVSARPFAETIGVCNGDA